MKKARPAQVIEECLKSSTLWPLVRVHHLHINMRAGPGDEHFARFLLQLGEGKLPTKQDDPFKGCIEIPSECVLPKSADIIQSVFDNFEEEHVIHRVILTPTNAEALSLNEKEQTSLLSS